MRIVRLDATGLEVEAPDNFYYQDDGLVSSIAIHTMELNRRYGYRITEYVSLLQLLVEETPWLIPLYKEFARLIGRVGSDSPIIAEGRCYYGYPRGHNNINDALESGEEVHAHIYVLNLLSNREIAFTRGHEETHVLTDLRKLESLEIALERRGIHTQILAELPTHVTCCIGGVYALTRTFFSDYLPVDDHYYQKLFLDHLKRFVET